MERPAANISSLDFNTVKKKKIYKNNKKDKKIVKF